MNMWVWAFFLGLMLVCFVILMLFVYFDSRQRRYGRIVTGTVLEWQKSRLPGFGRVIVDYTIKGRHYTCSSNLIPNNLRDSFKPKSMRRYILHKYAKTKKRSGFYIVTAIL